jgi:adenylate cyclase
MSLKKWLNDHNLFVSCLGGFLIVTLLYITALGLYASFTKFPYYLLETRAQDWVAQLGKTAPKDPRIYFLAADAASHNLDQAWEEDFEASPILKRMKQPNWPRDVYAAILDRLASAGARVVGFDFSFQGDLDGDSIFRASLDKYRDRVVVGSQVDDVLRGFTKRPQLNPPPKSLIGEITDPRLGFVNMYPDPDGIVRGFRFRTKMMELANLEPDPADPTFESLAVRMLGQAGLGGLVPPGRDRHLIRYAYKGETLRQQHRSQSVADIFIPGMWEANYQNGAFFKDKIVLVGPEGNLTKDVGESPFGTIAGPEFHLNAMNAILTNSFLHETSVWADIGLICSGCVAAYLLGRHVRNPVLRMALSLIMAGGMFLGAVFLFNRSDLVIPVFSPILALVGSSFTAVVWQQIIERLEKARLRRTFERYVSRDVVKELLDNPQTYLNSMVGVRKQVSVLFSDVRGFTTITESGDATQLVAQLNEYFDHMVGLVFNNRGTLDKFIGDAVMAQWGGITSRGAKDDAIDAVRTACQMRERLVELNKAWVKQGKLDLKIGIGVNAGEAIVGNLGCEAKAEISLIGDAVNTASRFEGMTKQFHVDLLIGETVAALVRDQFIVRTVALSQPKGKLRPVEVFTVLGERSADQPNHAWLADYEEGVKNFRARRFADAVAHFEKSLASTPGDWLCETYLQESRELVAIPPPEDWSPVDVMTSK